MNQIILSGRVSQKQELKTLGGDLKVINFNIAVSREYKDKTGEVPTDFFEVTVWRKSADFVDQYVSVGDLVGVVGKVQKRSYDKDGQKVWVVDVVADRVELLHKKETKQEVKEVTPEFELVQDSDLPF